MQPLKINYIDFSHNPHKVETLVRESDLINKNNVHYQCPVYKHKKTRTFIAHSPIDFELCIKNNNLLTSNDSFVSDVACQIDNTIQDIVIQLNFCNYAFWTKDSDIWLEYSSHPLTSLNNNYFVVDGWFNLSNWSRETSLAIQLVDRTKPVIIKKGDPIFKLTFLSANLDRGIFLDKKGEFFWEERYSEKNYKIFAEFEESRSEDYRKENKLFSKTDKKCPFS